MTAPLVATKSVALPLDVKAGETPGTFEGYGAVFGNRDRDGDIVSPGAFAESLQGGMPALLWQHDQKSPIGKFDEVREDERGLFVKGRLSLTGRGAEAYDLLKMGALNGLSIGFVTKEATRDPATSTRTITKADLMEVSLVTFPANEEARVTGVKSFDLNPAGDARAFERMLRENGFSRSRAKAITAKGFKAADMGMDEAQEVAGLIDSLKASQLRLEAKERFKKSLAIGPAWSSWIRLATVTYSEPGIFKITASSRNTGGDKMPFMLQIKYVSRRGRRQDTWLSNGGRAGNGPYKVPAGIQEVQVRGKLMGVPFPPQKVDVELHW